jgi:hypothetical protein
VELIQLLVTMAHKYYSQYLNILYIESGHIWLSDMSTQDVWLY